MRSPPCRPYRDRLRLWLLAALALCLGGSLVSLAAADNWADWRGPHQDGVSPDKDLPDHFSLDPKAADSNLIWKAPYGGRTTPIVLNGRVYIINGAGGETPDKLVTQQERVMCFDADTGKVLWQYKFNVWLTNIVADRLGWTNMVGDPATGYVYVQGTQGFLFCFDKDGKIVWQHSLTEEFGRISGYGGRLTSPGLDGDLLIISMLNSSWGRDAIGGNRFMAFDKRTGQVVWWGSTGARPKNTYSSSPVFATINGVRQVISGGGDGGVHGFQAHTGKKLWSYFFADGAVNAAPIVQGTRVWVGHGGSNPDSSRQGRVICVDAGKVTDGKPALVWKVDGIKDRFSTAILHGGRLYVADVTARLFCLDADTGKMLWRFSYGRNGFGSPVYGDGKIYVGAVNSTFDILKPEEKKCVRLYQQYFPSEGGAEVEINGSPAIANGRVYFLTSTDFYCIGKKDHKAAAADRGGNEEAEARAPSADKEGKAAQLQVFPADVTLNPGQSASFKVRVFDADGNFLHDAKDVQWSLAGMLPPVRPGGAPEGGAAPAPRPAPGTQAPAAPAAAGPPPLKGHIDEQGKLTVAKAPPGQFGRVVAKAEGLSGYARVRVAPTLPYHADFSKVPVGRTPAGWVNTQGKFVMKELEGKHVLMKTGVIPSPLVARADAYIGEPTLKNYTVQADVMGVAKGQDLPDMGVLAHRYNLTLEGNTQRLRLLAWEKLPRVDRSMAWSWKPDTWYTLKLSVEVHGDKGVVRGKAWPRGQKEPDNWTIEFEDPVPNREGSPGLYGNAVAVGGAEDPGTPIYYDNVTVTPNDK